MHVRARLRAHEELYCKEQAMVNRRSVMGLAARRTIALGLAPLGLAAMAAEPGAPLPPLGSTLAAPTLTLLDGSVWGPEQSRGKVLVLYWWASWCPFVLNSRRISMRCGVPTAARGWSCWGCR